MGDGAWTFEGSDCRLGNRGNAKPSRGLSPRSMILPGDCAVGTD